MIARTCYISNIFRIMNVEFNLNLELSIKMI